VSLPFVFEALRRRIALIVIMTLIVAASGIVLGAMWPKTYTSSAQIMLGLDDDDTPKIDAQSGNLYLKERVATYAQTVKADEVVEPVADAADIGPEALRNQITVAIVPETVVLEISVSAASPEEAVELTNAVSRRFSTQVSVLNVETGGPEIVAAQFSSPQPATEPDQLHGWLLIAVSSLVGLVLGVLVALLAGAIQAARRARTPVTPTDGEDATPAQGADHDAVTTVWDDWGDQDHEGSISGQPGSSAAGSIHRTGSADAYVGSSGLSRG